MDKYADHVRPAGPGVLSWLRLNAPVVTLIVLSPVLTELLMGTLRITNLWLLIPQMGVYGVAALLIREVVRRERRGWGAILLLGMAFAFVLECVILQTSLTPQFFAPAGTRSFGWVAGVQWIYLFAMLGYESTYAIVMPILLTELLFPDRRREPWLSQGGIIAACTVFLASSVGAWWLWRHTGLPRYGISAYEIPILYPALAVLVAILLVTGVLLLGRPPARPRPASQRRARSPWLAGLLAFVFGLFWFVLIGLPYINSAALGRASPLLPIATGLLWAGLAFYTVRRLSSAGNWRDVHNLALIFGAELAAMLGGMLAIIVASPIDRIGKLVFDLVAVALFAVLALRLRRTREPASRPNS